jgi:DNA invertase Pin-like site-specific DNA recombinase
MVSVLFAVSTEEPSDHLIEATGTLNRHPKPMLDIVPRPPVLAVGYARTATFSHSETTLGLEDQEVRIRVFAETERLKLVQVFADAGESAHNLARSGLQALLAAVATGGVDVIIMRDLSRLARDAADLRLLVDFVHRHGVRILSLDDQWGGV